MITGTSRTRRNLHGLLHSLHTAVPGPAPQPEAQKGATTSEAPGRTVPEGFDDLLHKRCRTSPGRQRTPSPAPPPHRLSHLLPRNQLLALLGAALHVGMLTAVSLYKVETAGLGRSPEGGDAERVKSSRQPESHPSWDLARCPCSLRRRLPQQGSVETAEVTLCGGFTQVHELPTEATARRWRGTVT